MQISSVSSLLGTTSVLRGSCPLSGSQSQSQSYIQWGGVFFLVSSKAVAGHRQQWGVAFFVVRSEAVTERGGSQLLIAFRNDRPDLSSEGAPDIGKTVNVKPKLMSGHDTQMELESRTYWSTERRS
jgi:hypothetical protein